MDKRIEALELAINSPSSRSRKHIMRTDTEPLSDADMEVIEAEYPKAQESEASKAKKKNKREE